VNAILLSVVSIIPFLFLTGRRHAHPSVKPSICLSTTKRSVQLILSLWTTHNPCADFLPLTSLRPFPVITFFFHPLPTSSGRCLIRTWTTFFYQRLQAFFAFVGILLCSSRNQHNHKRKEVVEMIERSRVETIWTQWYAFSSRQSPQCEPFVVSYSQSFILICISHITVFLNTSDWGLAHGS